MDLCLFEDTSARHLTPLTNTRALPELRSGRYTLGEALQLALSPDTLLLHTRSAVAPAVAERYPAAHVNPSLPSRGVLFVHGGLLPHPSWLNDVQAATAHNTPRTFTDGNTLVAAWCPDPSTLPANLLSHDVLPLEPFGSAPSTDLGMVPRITRLWHLVDALRDRLHHDLSPAKEGFATMDDRSHPHKGIQESAILQAPEQIHVAPDATVHAGAILNAEEGPIYIDSEAAVLEQAVVRGPIYIGPKSQIKIGANVEGSAFGTYSKVGGEVHDSIIQGYSNKGHMGFMGHSILGEWCNLGADTNTSNLKNDYGTVNLYDAAEEAFVDTNRQFMGLVMGDHSKCGINTMFNTGTVVGTSCNVYGGGFPPRVLPSFSWGSPESGFTDYRLSKALEVAARVMARRDKTLTSAQHTLLTHLFQATSPQRAAMHPGE